MDDEQVISLVKEYLKGNLTVEIYAEKYFAWGYGETDGVEVTVSVYLGDEKISESKSAASL